MIELKINGSESPLLVHRRPFRSGGGGGVELGLKHGLVVISWLKNPGFTTRN